MMDDRNDPNRPLDYSDYDRSRLSDNRFSGWGLPALIGAIVLIEIGRASCRERV